MAARPHAAYRPWGDRGQAEIFGEPWVPASSVLGDGTIDRRQNGACPVPTSAPAPTMTQQAFGKSQWVIDTSIAGHRAPRWVYDRPATTVSTDPRISVPGRHDPAVGNSQHDGSRWSIETAAALQGFPPDWPWHGTKTQIHAQIGNAVIPLMASVLVIANKGY